MSEAVSQMTMTVDSTPPELAVQVYQNYNFEHTYNEDLPITSYREQVSWLLHLQTHFPLKGAHHHIMKYM